MKNEKNFPKKNSYALPTLMQPNKKKLNTVGNKGFFTRLIEKLDKKMEEKSKENSCNCKTKKKCCN